LLRLLPPKARVAELALPKSVKSGHLGFAKVQHARIGSKFVKRQLKKHFWQGGLEISRCGGQHRAIRPRFERPGESRTQVQRLDDIFSRFKGRRVFLKIDTQGSEREVLEGAQESLNEIFGVQAELPIVHLYRGDCPCPRRLTI
jgi:FkbM family methyltransferase